MAATHPCPACTGCLAKQEKDVRWIVKLLTGYMTHNQRLAAAEQIDAAQAGCTPLKLPKRRRKKIL